MDGWTDRQADRQTGLVRVHNMEKVASEWLVRFFPCQACVLPTADSIYIYIFDFLDGWTDKTGADRRMDGKTDGRTDTGRQADRRTYGQTGRQAGKQRCRGLKVERVASEWLVLPLCQACVLPRAYGRTDRLTDRRTDGRTDRSKNGHTDRQAQTGRWTEGQKDGQTDRQTDRRIGRHTDGQTGLLGRVHKVEKVTSE